MCLGLNFGQLLLLIQFTFLSSFLSSEHCEIFSTNKQPNCIMANSKRKLAETTNIVDVTPYKPNLLLKAQVTAKTSLKDFTSNGKDTSMFSCQLLDNTSEIRMTFFAEQAKKFFETIQVGKIYQIEYFKVKTAQKQYNDLNHPFELNAVNNTSFNLDDTTASKSIKLNMSFGNLETISQVQEDCCKDIIVIIKSFDDVTETYSSIKNVTYKKRDIELIDTSETMITLTLWGDHSTDFKSGIGDVIAVERAKVPVIASFLLTSNSTKANDLESIDHVYVEQYIIFPNKSQNVHYLSEEIDKAINYKSQHHLVGAIQDENFSTSTLTNMIEQQSGYYTFSLVYLTPR
ncbi:hypothetical protein QAD02_012782 [Eretmocerus hayati]|uniref:Uncharacterized protein n=1 Tax=Eretmocerus hayati TaxID=131215 RepID=A0ACC2P5E7_9HYME|nr:hypothetical protein QAD02_012782 [Eretmocerus hayati]